MKNRITALLILLSCSTKAQVTGGQFAFEFLRLANSPHVSALGGINVAFPVADISFALQNPALMRPALHNQLGLNYNSFVSGISQSNLAYGYYVPKLKTAFALGIQYLNYGNFTQTDIYGNTLGQYKAQDYNITLAASKQYKERWRYGTALKMAQSHLGSYNAAALLADVGVAYTDSANYFSFGTVAKNMGFMTKSYIAGKNNAEALPFDLQIGFSKRFKHLPLRLFTTIHHLYEWDIRYNNPDDQINSSILNQQNNNTNKGNFSEKLFRHFIFGAELTLAKRLALSMAYNHQRRKELALSDIKGAAGYSFGLNLYLNKFQIHYARSIYSIAGAYNEFGLNFSLQKLTGSTKGSWAAQYPNWE